MGFFSKLAQGLKKTREAMGQKLDALFKVFRKVDEELFEELEEALVLSDVGLPTAQIICGQLRERVKKNKIDDAAGVKEQLREIICELLDGDASLHISTKPSVILVIGVNGVGKTTTIGKLAANLKRDGKQVIIGAADTFRAAAIDQLGIWAQRAGVDMIKQSEGSDPAAVVFDAIAAGKARGADVVICDTAGRLHNKKNLMEELAKIGRVVEREAPGCDLEVLLVLDAGTGQNALNQARQFKQAAGITGIILTKLDGTARGGVVLGIKAELEVPVKYVGVGEQIDDLRPFDAKEFAGALFEGVRDEDEPEREADGVEAVEEQTEASDE